MQKFFQSVYLAFLPVAYISTNEVGLQSKLLFRPPLREQQRTDVVRKDHHPVFGLNSLLVPEDCCMACQQLGLHLRSLWSYFATSWTLC